MSHNVLYMRGQVAELRGNIDEARRWYEEALSISPTHVKSMQRLVSLTAGGTPLQWGSPWKQQGARDPQILLWSQRRFARQANTMHKASSSAPPEGGVTGALGAGGTSLAEFLAPSRCLLNRKLTTAIFRFKNKSYLIVITAT